MVTFHLSTWRLSYVKMCARYIWISVVLLTLTCYTSAYRWGGVTVDSDSWYEIINIDVTVIGETSLILAVQGCKGADIVLYEELDSGGFVYVRFGDSDNQYSVMFASTHCDASGCSPGGYEVAAHLDCNSYKVFWMQWDGQGTFQVGRDNLVGTNMFMTMNYNTDGTNGIFNLRYAKVTANVPGEFITFQFLIDNPPTISSPDPWGRTLVNVSEDALIGTDVVNFAATDLEGDTLLWGILSGDSGAFTVNYSTEFLQTNTSYDYETEIYQAVTVGTFDGMTTVNTTFTLEVLDVDDNDPVLTIATGRTFQEELPVDSILGGLYTMLDVDTFQDFTFAISGTDASYFKAETDGTIKVLAVADREIVTSLTFTLTVTDSGGHAVSGDVTVTIDDRNDNAPDCSTTFNFAQVEEAGASTDKILDLTCADADDGVNGQTDTAISVTDAANAVSTTGMEVHVDKTLIDYEGSSSSGYRYFVVVNVFDTPAEGPVNTGRVAVVVEIQPKNEFTPEFVTPAVNGGTGKFPDVTLSEDSVPGHVLVIYTASDDDGADDGVLVFELVSVTDNTGASALDKFHIDPEDGELRLAQTVDADATVTSYNVVVKVSDKGATPNTAQATQTVQLQGANDSPPVFNSAVYETSVDEDTAVGGTVIDIDVTDVDGDTVTLTLSGDSLALFEASGTSIVVKQALDYETARCHSIGITASDGVHDAYSEMTVDVTNFNDEAPVITITSHNTMNEEIPTGTVISGYYDIVDPDGADTFTYELTGTGSSYLDVNSDGHLYVTTRIDREALTSTTLDLSLKVTDSNSNSATETFQITVEDINDNTPECGQAVITFDLEEAGTDSDKKLQDALTCTDADTGNNAVVNLAISSGDTAGIFRYDGLELWGAPDQIDYEGLSASNYQYRLVVEASDTPDHGDPNVGIFVVIIQVTGKNEDAPDFTSPTLAGSAFPDVSISEDTAPGTVVETFAASDADEGVDGDVIYEIVSVTTDTGTAANDVFQLGGQSGKLIVSGMLDADTDTGGVAYYEVVVKAIDGGTPTQELQGTLKITLTGVNDNAPVFTNVVYELTVAEDAAVNDVVAGLTVTDADGDTVTLTATAGDTTEFGISGTDVVLLATVDFETQTCYYLDIQADDGTHTTNISLTIKVSNVMDETPTVTAAATTEMFEETPIGTVLYGLYTVADADVGDTLTVTVAGTDAGYFTVSSSGDLEVSTRVDGETTSLLSVDVTVTDNGGLTDTTSLSITVIDINDHAPTCDQYVYAFTLAEGSGADATVTDLTTCTDDDDGDNANFVLAVTAGDDAGVFSFTNTELHADADSIDYESMASSGFKYYLTVSVTDQPTEGPQNTAYVLVVITVTDANDNNPVWDTTIDASDMFTAVSTPESSPLGSSVTSFAASDGDLGAFGDVTYDIVSTVDDSGGAVTNTFWMHPETGDLYITAILDVDNGGVAYYDVTVSASDSASQSATGTIRVTVDAANDNAPSFDDTEFKLTVAESAAIGDTVGSLAVTDLDAGDSPTLSVIGASGGTFSGSGLDVITAATLDFETERCYSVLVRASDGVHNTDRLIAVEVTDVDDESPVITVHTGVSIPEELPAGVNIGQVFSVTDPDTSSGFTYAISGSQSSYFTIDSTTGILSIANNIDYDGSSGVSFLDQLTVTVTDTAANSATASFRIDVTDVNDMTPVFSQLMYTASVAENAASVKVVTLTCTDADSGTNAAVTLSLPTGQDHGGIFSLTGNDLFADGSLLDLENTASYSVTVICEDTPTSGTANTGATLVHVEVTGENENDPSFTSPTLDAGTGYFPDVALTESDAAGTLVSTFAASDADAGAGGVVTFNIVTVTTAEGSTVSEAFFMDASTGELRTAVSLDADVGTGGSAFYEVVVSAADTGTSVRSATGTVKVTVTDEDDNGPRFTQLLFTGSATCANVVDDVVSAVTVTDADTSTGTFAYSIPVASTYLDVDTATGDIKLKVATSAVPREDRKQFVVVEAVDSADATRTDYATVNVDFDNCDPTTTTTTTPATTVTTTTTASPKCEPKVSTMVIVLGVMCGVMAASIAVAIFLNVRSISKPSVKSHNFSKGDGDAFERPLEEPVSSRRDDMTLDDPNNDFVFDSLPPYSTVGGRFEQLP